ncbi:iron uptake transporter permease EfeU (plasmid) [Thioclava litoralis]|uniref:Iron uptake transporter permease EfeU n=1 Tax=Thioclava litoralis TaxID=3076557 RepID=A0ABZ1E505_9RHOB|nr:iron uptake transporter permease EfeU [Thioclava sp. FTW29]
MLATLVIALREGLEASLIVGIIAAFLRRNGVGLGAMWTGVIAALVLSLAVGLGLNHLEQSLPQARQEALETVIGAVAIVFVTGMILWMDKHGRDMRSSLESEAAAALGGRRAFALALMAFLAVLKEGFETAVFFLATFSAAQSTFWAACGAVIGLGLAVAIGWGIYAGGVRLNLSRFFRVTGAFLLLVAAGLCVTALRTAHEAGWINAGQQLVVNLSWLVQPGTVRAALMTGVLGIPADPRLIEVLGWLAYLGPVALMVYWPKSRPLAPRTAARLKLGAGAVLALVGVGLLLTPQPRARLRQTAPLTTIQGDMSGELRLAHADLLARFGTAELRLAPIRSQDASHNGQALNMGDYAATLAIPTAPDSVSFADLVALNGGRRPIGLNPTRYPGPYAAQWQADIQAQATSGQGAVVAAQARSSVSVTLSGGGLQTPRSLRVREVPDAVQKAIGPARWAIPETYTTQAKAAYRDFAAALQEWQFWCRQFPLVLLAAALACALRGARQRRRLSPESFHSTAGARAEPAAKGMP